MKKSIFSCVVLFSLLVTGNFATAQTAIGSSYVLPICLTKYHEFGDKYQGYPQYSQTRNGNSWASGNGAIVFIEKRISKVDVNAGIGFVQNNIRIDVSGYSNLNSFYKPLILKRNFLLSELNCTWQVINKKSIMNVGFAYRFICNFWDPFGIDTLQLTAFPKDKFQSARELLPVHFTNQGDYEYNHILGIIANYNRSITSGLQIRLGLGMYSGIKSQWITSAYQSSTTDKFVNAKYHVTNGTAVEFKVSLIHELSKTK
ncbi:MAG: hypothetical protein RLZ10_1015 [Bacteroidota bacterium]|jgi:hypothetical protein